MEGLLRRLGAGLGGFGMSFASGGNSRVRVCGSLLYSSIQTPAREEHGSDKRMESEYVACYWLQLAIDCSCAWVKVLSNCASGFGLVCLFAPGNCWCHPMSTSTMRPGLASPAGHCALCRPWCSSTSRPGSACMLCSARWRRTSRPELSVYVASFAGYSAAAEGRG